MSRPITIQPGHKLLPSNTVWSNELLESCNPISDGIVYTFCYFCCAGRLHERTGENYFSCLFAIPTIALRTKLRMAFDIRGTLINDCLSSCCCPCSLLQMKKELDKQGIPDPYAK